MLLKDSSQYISNITQIANRSHTDLTSIGTNTHAQIDTHIAASNPHSGSQPLDSTLTSIANVAGVQGDILYADGSDTWNRLAKDATATRYLSNTGASNNPAWAQVNVANGVTGTLPIANGGTGQTSATAAFNALDPMTLKGDVITHDGTNSVRQGVGSNGQVLTADSTVTNGIKWATGPSATVNDILMVQVFS